MEVSDGERNTESTFQNFDNYICDDRISDLISYHVKEKMFDQNGITKLKSGINLFLTELDKPVGDNIIFENEEG